MNAMRPAIEMNDAALIQSAAVAIPFKTGGTPAAASFDVTGEGNEVFSITFPSSATLTSGANYMTIDTFKHDAGGNPKLSGGSLTFNVGAKLHVGAAQAEGTYSGTFAVTVNYN